METHSSITIRGQCHMYQAVNKFRVAHAVTSKLEKLLIILYKFHFFHLCLLNYFIAPLLNSSSYFFIKCRPHPRFEFPWASQYPWVYFTLCVCWRVYMVIGINRIKQEYPLYKKKKEALVFDSNRFQRRNPLLKLSSLLGLSSVTTKM